METKYYCKGPKHHPENKEKDIESTMVETTVENPWCSVECDYEYWGKPKIVATGNKENFQKFLDRGKIIEEKKRREAEAAMAA